VTGGDRRLYRLEESLPNTYGAGDRQSVANGGTDEERPVEAATPRDRRRERWKVTCGRKGEELSGGRWARDQQRVAEKRRKRQRRERATKETSEPESSQWDDRRRWSRGSKSEIDGGEHDGGEIDGGENDGGEIDGGENDKDNGERESDGRRARVTKREVE